MARRTAGDVTLRQEDLGGKVQGIVGATGGKVSVRALAKAWDQMAQYREPEPELQHNPNSLPKGGAKSDGSAAAGEEDLNLDDDLDLDAEDLAAVGAEQEDELELELDDLDLDEGDDAVVGGGGDDELELELDDLDLEDEDAGGAAAADSAAKPAAQTLDAGDLGEDDLDMDDIALDDDASDPSAGGGDTAPAAAGGAAPSAGGSAASAPAAGGPVSYGTRPDGSRITMITIPSHALPNNRFLHEPFKVVKVDEGALLGTKKERIWDVDCFLKKLSNLDMSGYKSFSLKAMNLFRVEKHISDPRRLILYFFESTHPYDLVMTSVERRNRLFEIATLLRRSSVMWCPSLCPETDEDALINVIGTTIMRPSGKPARVTGDCKFMVARMPYEIIDFWYGCINMQQRPLPPNHSMLDGFLPRGTHDIYVIGVADVSGSLMGKPELGLFFQAYLGAAYHVLTQTTTEGKDKPTKGNNAIIIICRRTFIVRMSNIEAIEIDTVRREGTAKGDFSGVATSFRVNETTICCVMANTTPFLADAGSRSANLRALLSNVNVGNDSLDIGARFDYCFIGGALGYTGAYSEHDQLIEQRTAGNFLSEFIEATPEPTLKARGAGNPIRFLYNVRHNVCRFDAKGYNSQPAMNLNNSYVCGDIYTRRSFLSTFGEPVSKMQFRISHFAFTPKRVPPFLAPEIRFTGEWIDSSPLQAPLVKDGAHLGIQSPNSTAPLIKPCVHSFEFLRLQHIEITVLGVLANSKDKKKKITIASGSFSLKNNFALNEPKDFTVNVVYRGCVVGHVSGKITYETDGTTA